MKNSEHTPTVCIGALGSLTLAIKAERALLGHGIAAHTESLSPGETRHGCAFGVAFPCTAEREARAILRDAGISITQYLRREAPTP